MLTIIKSLLGVARAPFLLLPVTLVAAGAAASAYDGGISLLRTAAALVGLLALHIGVNAINEAADMRSGIDLKTVRTPFSGGSGTLPAGKLSIRAAYSFGFVATAVGLAIGVWFLIQVGWVLVPIVAVGAFSVLMYTHLLLRIGVGEVFAGLGLGALPIVGAAVVQDGVIGPAAVGAAAPAFFMTFNLLLLNEFPDAEADRAGGRRHLVILLGRAGAARIYAIAAIAAPASIVAAVVYGALPALCIVAVLPTLLVAPALRWTFTKASQPVPTGALAGNVIWNLATNVLNAVALGVCAWQGWS